MVVIKRTDGAALIVDSADYIWPNAANPANTFVRYSDGVVVEIYSVSVDDIISNAGGLGYTTKSGNLCFNTAWVITKT